MLGQSSEAASVPFQLEVPLVPEDIVNPNDPQSASLPCPDITPHSEGGKAWFLYWISITPMVCGAQGPVLTLLTIAGCVDQWRIILENGERTNSENPRWVVGVTALTIIIGLIPNLFLSLRMMGRGNPKYLQIWSIGLWALECMHPFALLSFSGYELYHYRVLCWACRRRWRLAIRTRLLDDSLRCSNVIHLCILAGPQLAYSS